MAARVLIKMFLLEEAKREDTRRKKREGLEVRSIRLLSTDEDYIRIFRLRVDDIMALENNLSPFLPSDPPRRGAIDNRTKVDPHDNT